MLPATRARTGGFWRRVGNDGGRVKAGARGGRAGYAHGAATTGGADEGVLEGASSVLGGRSRTRYS
jgi:hypothetical protein